MHRKSSLSFFLSPILIACILLNGSCSKYTVITGQRDPADSYYKQRVTASYFWGLVNKPDRVVDTTCGSAGLDEVKINTNLGYSIIHVATLGIVSIVKVQWKCHKPAPVVGFQP